jgi:hypothetical protein
MKDYYQILKVKREASELEIKRSYRRLAIQYHPDKNPDPSAEEQFKEISEAFEVLSDPAKKASYDSRMVNALEGLFETEQQPTHRDPAYRRKRPPVGNPVRPATPSELINQYVPYFRIFCWLGIFITTLFFLDYVLPYSVVNEEIREIYDVRGGRRRNVILYHVIETFSNRKIKMYDGAEYFYDEEKLIADYTKIFATPMQVSTVNGEQVVMLGYVYGAMLFLPVVLWITSLLGIIFNKRTEFCFNLSVVSGILLVIVLYLIL